MFFKGSTEKAREALDTVNSKIRTKDAVKIAFFLGAITILLIFLIFFAQVADMYQYLYWVELSSGMETYTFCFVICFILFSTAVAIQVFRHY